MHRGVFVACSSADGTNDVLSDCVFLLASVVEIFQMDRNAGPGIGSLGGCLLVGLFESLFSLRVIDLSLRLVRKHLVGIDDVYVLFVGLVVSRVLV